MASNIIDLTRTLYWICVQLHYDLIMSVFYFNGIIKIQDAHECQTATGGDVVAGVPFD